MRTKLLFLALALVLTAAVELFSAPPAYACLKRIDCGDYVICCVSVPCPVCESA